MIIGKRFRRPFKEQNYYANNIAIIRVLEYNALRFQTIEVSTWNLCLQKKLLISGGLPKDV